jgi:hypothetical protein
MDDLPVEILDQIANYLPNFDQLYHFGLVNKHWFSVAKAIYKRKIILVSYPQHPEYSWYDKPGSYFGYGRCLLCSNPCFRDYCPFCGMQKNIEYVKLHKHVKTHRVTVARHFSKF